MKHDLTHASFFSGVGGLDLGLERAGWRTVSFSEIDPYASAVLAERWPGVPNLGSIVDLAGGVRRVRLGEQSPGLRDDGPGSGGGDAWHRAILWTGGFPCQDLSVVGKRRGMGEGTRSGLAYAFLALAERHRPRYVLLENVPGLLSSHGGRDMAALLGALVELGYGVGYRILDARYFGVPQRRRRVFILGVSPGGRAGAERAAEVLSVGSRCRWHPPAGVGSGEELASESGHGVAADGARSTRTISAGLGHHGYTYGAQDWIGGWLQPVAPHDARGQGRRGQGSAAVRGYEPDDGHQPDADPVRRAERPSADPDRVRATDGLAGRLDDRGLAATLNSGGNQGGFRTEPGEHLVATSLQASAGHHGHSSPRGDGSDNLVAGGSVSDDPLLPLGLDSHRYRCCGNGVVSDVAEWIGLRLAALT